MRLHSGEHARMGAVDVVPFIPIKGVTMEECIDLSNRYAKLVSDEHSLPFFYMLIQRNIPQGFVYQIYVKENMKDYKKKYNLQIGSPILDQLSFNRQWALLPLVQEISL